LEAVSQFEIPPSAFGSLLSKLGQQYPSTTFALGLKDTANFWILERLNALLEDAADQIPETALLEASTTDDVQVDTYTDTRQGPRYLHEINLAVAHETLDCSFLRGAAQRELERRRS
jgi:hypothetical protein